MQVIWLYGPSAVGKLTLLKDLDRLRDLFDLEGTVIQLEALGILDIYVGTPIPVDTLVIKWQVTPDYTASFERLLALPQLRFAWHRVVLLWTDIATYSERHTVKWPDVKMPEYGRMWATMLKHAKTRADSFGISVELVDVTDEPRFIPLSQLEDELSQYEKIEPIRYEVPDSWVELRNLARNQVASWKIRGDGMHVPYSTTKDPLPDTQEVKVVQVHKDWKQLVDTLSSIYHGDPNRIYQPIDHPFFSSWSISRRMDRFEKIIAFLKLSPCRPKTALDIGSNLGGFPRMLEKAGLQVTATEGSEKLVEVSNYLNRIFGTSVNYVNSSNTIKVIQDHGPFDLVSCISVNHRRLQTKEGRQNIGRLYRKILANCQVFVTDLMHPREKDIWGATPDRWKDPLAFMAFMKKLGAKEVYQIPLRETERPAFIVRGAK